MTASTASQSMDERLQALREAGAAQHDPLRWHYIEVLARRTQAHTGAAQALLQDKLRQALDDLQARLALPPQAAAGVDVTSTATASLSTPSALTQLLHDMRTTGSATPLEAQAQRPGLARPAENPRVQKFRQQLRKIRVKKQVQQAIDQAPANAGPINSHMLVLRALGLMRDLSPDYLDRFMTHIDTLLCLEQAEKDRLNMVRKAPAKPSKK